MKNLTENLLSEYALDRSALALVFGGIEEDGGAGSCTAKCRNGTTVKCEGSPCEAHDPTEFCDGWCLADGIYGLC